MDSRAGLGQEPLKWTWLKDVYPFVIMLVIFPIVSIFLSLCLVVYGFACWPWFRIPLLLYFAWIAFDRSPAAGGYSLFWRTGLTKWLRKRFWWRVQAHYYPLALHKTGDISDSDGPLLFCNHPHGVIGVGTMATFGADANKFGDAYPGLTQPLHLLGLNRIFQIPFFREWVMMHGHATPGKKTMLALLGAGHNLALNTGGAREALDAHPGTTQTCSACSGAY
jgi:2-acylglycerol O-acyltransferase 2